MKAQALGDTSSLEFMRGRRILEINPDHPIVKDLNVRPLHLTFYIIFSSWMGSYFASDRHNKHFYVQAACKNAPDSTDAKRAVDLLYDTALISSGFTVSANHKLTFYSLLLIFFFWGLRAQFVTSPQTVQPDSPADLGNKIYEMMAMALGGRWGRSDGDEAESVEGNATESEISAGEASEAQVVEPSEVRNESDPWQD